MTTHTTSAVAPTVPVRIALGLFVSCIKSGEAWSPECETVWESARQALAAQQREIDDHEQNCARWLLAVREAEDKAEALEKERDEAREAMAEWEQDRNEWGRQVHDQIDRADKAEAEVAALQAKLDRAAEALEPFARVAPTLPVGEGGKSWLFDMHRKAVVSGEQVERAATVHAELARAYAASVASIPTTSGGR